MNNIILLGILLQLLSHCVDTSHAESRPNPPRLVGVECNLKTALITWQPMGDNGAPILSYVVQYNTSFTPDTWEVAFEAAPASEFKSEVSLSPWANYSFRVLARNKIGYSLPSGHSSTCETPPDVPYKNPDHVQGQGTTPNNLVISWTPMPETEHNGPGFYYKVYWKRNTTLEWMNRTVTDWNQTNLVVDNQPTFQPYVIKVEAHNVKGQANVAAVKVVGYSGEGYPLEAPQRLELLEISLDDGNPVTLRWQPVPQESIQGHFKGYKIQTWTKEEEPLGDKRLREAIVPPNTTVAVVDIFVPFALNYVKVLAFNGRYDGPQSEMIWYTAPEGRPGPVASFAAVPIGSSALRLVWKKPYQTNGRLRGYKIYYEPTNGTGTEREPEYDDPNSTSKLLHGLEPNTTYRVTIKAYTYVGDGTPYSIEVTTGDTTAPYKPMFMWQLLEMRNGTGRVLVTWLPNLEGRAGSHFYVQYRKRGETEFLNTKDILDDDSVEVSGLEPGTVYEIRVVAVNGPHHVQSDIEEVEIVGSVGL